MNFWRVDGRRRFNVNPKRIRCRWSGADAREATSESALRGRRVGHMEAHVSRGLFHAALCQGGLRLGGHELLENVRWWTCFEEFFDLCRQPNQDEVIQLPRS